MLHRRHWLIVAGIAALVFSQSAHAVDVNPADGVDDRLRVSVAAPWDQSFPETDLVEHATTAVLDFDSCDPVALTNGEDILASPIAGGDLVAIGSGSGSIECDGAWQYGGAFAEGSYVYPASEWTLTFYNRQEYIGFWWSAGNHPNDVQLLDEYGEPILDPEFMAESLYQTLFGVAHRDCTPNNIVNDYCGNPNIEYQGIDHVSAHIFSADSEFRRGVPTEPYAFIHIRYDLGFHGVRFSGAGFEFDNLTVSEEAPLDGNEESFISELPAYSLATSSEIPVDPRSQSVSFPGILLGGDAIGEANATMCLTQVTDSSGTASVDSENTSISLSAPVNVSVSQAGQPPNFVYSGGQSDVQAFSSQLKIVPAAPNRPVANSGSVWIRVSVSAQSSGGEATCTTTGGEITSTVVELRPLQLSNTNLVGVTID